MAAKPITKKAKKDSVPMGRLIAPSAKDRLESNPLGPKQSPNSITNILRTALGGNIKSQYEVYELMEDSWARLAKDLHELKIAAARSRYTVMPYAANGEKPSPQAEQKANFVQFVIDNWKGSGVTNMNGFRDCIYDICDAVGKGYSVQEMLWRPTQNGAIMDGTYFLHPRYYGFFAEQPNLMLNPNADGNYVDFPANKFIVATYKNKSGNTMGYGLLRQLAYWWSGQNYCRDWLLNFAQVYGQPLRWATYDPGASTGLKNDIANMLENMGAAAWGAFPSGTEVEFKEAGKSGPDNPQNHFMEIADRHCDITLLGQTLTTDISGAGSYALGQVHQDVRMSRLHDITHWVASVLNEQWVPAICHLNYGSHEEMPTLVPDLSHAGDPNQEAQRDQLLLQAGMEIPRKWFYERHAVPMPQEGEDVVKQETETASFLGKETVTAEEQLPSATDKLAANILEEVTGVSEKWLSPIKPTFTELVGKAMKSEVSDSDFVAALSKAEGLMPELFDEIDTSVLEKALEDAMGAAAVNGAVQRISNAPAMPK